MYIMRKTAVLCRNLKMFTKLVPLFELKERRIGLLGTRRQNFDIGTTAIL